jgi:hypothetical protein
MRLLFSAELSVDAESLEDAWKLAKDVEARASAVSDGASLRVKMASIAVLDDEVERKRRRRDPGRPPHSPGGAALGRTSPERPGQTARSER